MTRTQDEPTGAGLELRDGVATVRLSRPERRNAMSRETLLALLARFEEAERDPDTRLIVIRGEGDAFSTGADLEEIHRLCRERNERKFRELAETGCAVVRRLRLEVRKPVVAVVDGPAAGSGLGLAVASDWILATNRATFGATQVRVGLHPDFGLTLHLPRRVAPALAAELLCTGRIIDAHEAVKIGLVDRIASAVTIEQELRSFGERVLSAPAPVVASVLKLVGRKGATELDDALRAEVEAQMAAFRSPDLLRRLEALRERFTKTELGSYRV